jgi:transposase
MTVYRARKRYANEGIASIHRDKPDREYKRKLDGEAEAQLIALACSDPPEGRARWTLRLLADELVAHEAVDIDTISPETVRKTLKKTNSSLTDPNNG